MYYCRMKKLILLLLFVPLIGAGQESSKEFYIGYEVRNPQGYDFSGFILGSNYKFNKIPLLNKVLSSDNYYLNIELGHSVLSEIPKKYTRNGNMQTVKLGYKFMTYYNLYYLLRFRIDAVSDPSYRYNAPRPDDYPMKSFTAYGPDLMIGKKINFNKSFFIDLSLGATYNWSYERVMSGNGWFDRSKLQSYSWLNSWSKGALKIGYQF